MKNQLLFIHGATSFSKYDDFLEYLKTSEIGDPLIEPPQRWKDTLRTELEADYEVYLPSMPNKQNAKYAEWKLWFERYIPYMRDEAALVGHSHGGYFLAKYLSEHTLPFSARALFILGSPASPGEFSGEDGGDFAFDHGNAPRIAQNARKIFIFHSKDDPVVPFSHAEIYKKLLPNAELVVFEDKGHFRLETFPELIERIRASFQ